MSKARSVSQVELNRSRRLSPWFGLLVAGLLLAVCQPGDAEAEKEQENRSEAMFVSQVELKPGMSGEELEKFWVEEFLPNLSKLPGYTPTLHKGTSGRRPGHYLMVNYFASAERARQLFPATRDAVGRTEISEEFNQWAAANPVWGKAMNFFDYEKIMDEFTQYSQIK